MPRPKGSKNKKTSSTGFQFFNHSKRLAELVALSGIKIADIPKILEIPLPTYYTWVRGAHDSKAKAVNMKSTALERVVWRFHKLGVLGTNYMSDYYGNKKLKSLVKMPTLTVEAKKLQKEKYPFADEGKKFKLLRKKLGLSQVQIAKKLKITQGMYSQIESGYSKISPNLHSKIKSLT